jgi:signal transduction histidine kinase
MSSASDGEVQRLQNRCAELDRKVQTLSTDNDKLRRLNAEITQERIEYLQNVSHQLVAPLHAIKWHIENLTHGRVSGAERAKKVLRSIYSQATIAVHLAKNFVFMSNLEADHSLKSLREPLEPIELDRLLVNLADDFQPLGWNNNLQIHVDVPSFDDVPDVYVIKHLISQVFGNLIENAVKYSQRNTIISISGRYISVEDAAVVTIASEGVAIAQEDKDRIFERGVRTKAAADVYPAGTGFGLYIARKIMDIHEGEIRAVIPRPGVAQFEVVVHPRKLQGKAREWPKK